MSQSLVWTNVPVEAEVLGGTTHPFKGWVLTALSFGSSQDVGLHDVRGLVLEKNSHAHAYLTGMFELMPVDHPDRDVLSALLGDIDRLGKVQLEVQ